MNTLQIENFSKPLAQIAQGFATLDTDLKARIFPHMDQLESGFALLNQNFDKLREQAEMYKQAPCGHALTAFCEIMKKQLTWKVPDFTQGGLFQIAGVDPADVFPKLQVSGKTLLDTVKQAGKRNAES